MVRHDAGYAEIVSLLLAYNAETGIVDSDGNTALSFSVLRGLTDVVSLLEQPVQKD
jgi:ankyrin repeat protein